PSWRRTGHGPPARSATERSAARRSTNQGYTPTSARNIRGPTGRSSSSNDVAGHYVLTACQRRTAAVVRLVYWQYTNRRYRPPLPAIARGPEVMAAPASFSFRYSQSRLNR